VTNWRRSSLAQYLQGQKVAIDAKNQQRVSDVSYAGDEGGIVYHIVPSDERRAWSLKDYKGYKYA
jgi:hypothetical protein